MQGGRALTSGSRPRSISAILNVHLGTQHHATLALRVRLADAVAHDQLTTCRQGTAQRSVQSLPSRAPLLADGAPRALPTCREIWARDVAHQLLHRDVWVADECPQPVHHLAHVVGRDFGGNAHRDATRPVDQKVGHPGGQHQRLHLQARASHQQLGRAAAACPQSRAAAAQHAPSATTLTTDASKLGPNATVSASRSAKSIALLRCCSRHSV